jgi:hypothetical protein
MVRQWLSDAFAKSPTTKFLLRTMPDDAAEDIEILLRRVDQTIEPGAGDQLAAALRFLLHTQIQHDLAHTIEQEIYENGLVQARATIPLDK